MSAGRALVTGSSSGIGLAISEALLEGGYEVVGLSRSGGGPAHPRFEAHTLDLGDLDSLAKALPALVRSCGDVDALLLAAGRGALGALEEMSYTAIRSLVDLDFTSQAYLARAWLPAMKTRGTGTVVFVGSEAGHKAGARGSVYCGAKFALRGLAQALRLEASGSGVRVSYVAPGMTRTAFFDDLEIEPGERPENALSAEDVARSVVYVLDAPPGAVVDEVRLTPLRHVVRRKRR